MPAILAGPIGREFGISPAWTFGGLSAALIVSSVIGPAVGRFVDEGGARKALVAANVAFAAGLALLGLSHGPVLMMIGWLTMGLGMGLGYYETAFAALTRLYGAGARNLISGVTLIAGFTSTVSWPLMAWLEPTIGWRGVCFFWVAANLFVALPLNLTVPPPPAPASAPPAEADPSTAPTGDRSELRAMIAIAILFAATSFVGSGLSAVMPRLLIESGATHAAAIGASALIGPAQVAGRLAELAWLRRYHPLLSARLGTIFLPIGVGALLVGGAVFAPPFAILYGLGNGILTIARGTLPLAIFGPEGYGRRVGVLSAPARIAGAAAPLALGLLFDAYGATGLVLAAALNLVGFAALFFVSNRSRAGR